MNRLIPFISSSLFWLLPGRLDILFGRTFFIGMIDLIIISVLFLFFYFLPMRKKTSSNQRLTLLFLIFICIVRFASGFYWTQEGLLAKYYPNTEWKRLPEFSWCFKSIHPEATRVDSSIHFNDKGYSPFNRHFPLYFVNNKYKFNWHGTEKKKEDRKHFQFSVHYAGYLKVLPKDPNDFVLLTDGGHSKIEIDNIIYETKKSSRLSIHLNPGIHKIDLHYARVGKSPRKLLFGWVNESGKITPVNSSRFSYSKTFSQFNFHLRILNYVLHTLWLVLTIILIKQRFCFPTASNISLEKILTFVLLIMCLFSLFSSEIDKGAKPYSDILSGGDDYLTYETQSRDILKGDFLNVRHTQNKPYYMGVLYRYLLSGLHLIFGESTRLLITSQKLIVIGILYGLFKFGQALYSTPIGLAIACQAHLFGRVHKYSTVLLDTTFTIAFSILTIFYLISYGRSNKLIHCILAGISLGVLSLIRGNGFIFLPFALLWIFWQTQSSFRNRVKKVVVFGIIVIAPLLLVGSRNLYVADSFKILPISGPINLWLGNHSPNQEELVTFKTANAPEDKIAGVIGYIRTEPQNFIKGLGLKALYILGINPYNPEKSEIKGPIFIPNILLLALCISSLFIIKNFNRRAELSLLISWICVNAGILILIFPWGYGWRLCAPFIPIVYILNAILFLEIFKNIRLSQIKLIK